VKSLRGKGTPRERARPLPAPPPRPGPATLPQSYLLPGRIRLAASSARGRDLGHVHEAKRYEQGSHNDGEPGQIQGDYVQGD
jgi:hypothetical protein